MSADIVNLRQARKRKIRADKESCAAENRVRFGRDKAAKSAEKAELDRTSRNLDGKHREPGNPTD